MAVSYTHLVELGGQAEVQLAGGQSVLGTHGGLDVHVQLRAVEGSLADLLLSLIHI